MKRGVEAVLPEVGSFRVICHTCRFQSKSHPLHWHDNCELCRVIEGSVTFRVGNMSYDATPGDLLVLEKGALHQFVVPEREKPAVVRILQYAYPLLFDSGSTLKKPQVFIPSRKIGEFPGISEKIDALLDLLEAETVLGQTEVSPYVRHLVSALFFLLSDAFPADEATPFGTDKSDFYLTVAYVKEHFKEDLTVEKISKALGIPRRRLAANFKNHAGFSLCEYIRIERVNYVNYLLSEGRSICMAAMESGFQNLHTFGSTYERLVGCTPSEYIKRRGTPEQK